MTGKPHLIAALVALCILICGTSTAGETPASDKEDPLQCYHDALSSGRLTEAVNEGQAVLDKLRATGSDPALFTRIDKRLDAVRTAREAATNKLRQIAQSAGSSAPAPLLYVMPQPSEMFQKSHAAFLNSRISPSELPEEHRPFLTSFLKLSLRAADTAVVEASRSVETSNADPTAQSKARAYLTAYVVGAHEEGNCDRVLQMLSEATGGVPSFLADSLLHEVGRYWAVRDLYPALDRFAGDDWPVEDRAELLKDTAAAAVDSEEDYTTALWAYDELASLDAPGAVEEALLRQIEIYSKKLYNHQKAIEKCTEFLERFPSSKEVLRVECRRAFCSYKTRDEEATLGYITEIQSDHPDTEACAYATLLEAMIYSKQQSTKPALEKLATVSTDYPDSAFAPKALLLSGIIRLQNQDYTRAKECFQRIMDFYPESQEVSRAKEYFDKLDELSTNPASSGSRQ